jgi:ribosomal protein S18 acetylase RimI-like enzyme
MFYDRGEDAIALYEQHGYRFQFAEEELEFDLQNKLPDYPLPPGITVHTWSPENANKFYNAYRDSFSTRTTSLMEEDAWAHHFANPRDDGFQPKLSLLVTSADQAMAFAVCHTDSFQNDEKPKLVWITQMGVHAEYRRQKIGTAILSELLHRYIKAGFDYAKLSVNIDNPSAKALYEKVGFSPINRFTLYRKEVDP